MDLIAPHPRRAFRAVGLIAVTATTLWLAVAAPGSDAKRASGDSAGVQPLNGSGGCPDGYVCIWGLNDYQGCWKDMNNDQAVYGGLVWTGGPGSCAASIDNGANSVKNRHNCSVRMSDAPGAGSGGPSITFANRFAGNNQDAALGNGAQGDPSSWANRISRHKFCP